jgi:hypothetical protein
LQAARQPRAHGFAETEGARTNIPGEAQVTSASSALSKVLVFFSAPLRLGGEILIPKVSDSLGHATRGASLSAESLLPRRAVITSKLMLFESDKVMFEIYRETEYTGQYRVCYFTELQDHNKETEINHALAGEHFFDGFIKNFGKDEAKEIISSLLGRMNNGERLDPQDVERALGDHMA